MPTKSKRLMSLLLGMGLCLIAAEAPTWSWNQHQPGSYNGFEGQSPGYGPAGYGYHPVSPKIHRPADRPYYYGGYRHQYRWPGYGYYRLSLLPGLSLLTPRASGDPRATEPRQRNFPRATDGRRECRRGVWARAPRLPTARAAAAPLSGDHLAARPDAPAGKVLGVTPMCVEPTR